MQSAYVEVGAGERVGDEVVLLGEGLESRDLAGEWGMTPQEVLVRLGMPGGQ
jgi:alanine racemase